MTIEFKTEVHNKNYTRCKLNKIVGSSSCQVCRYFVEKISYNFKVQGHFVETGLVECKADAAR